MKERTQNPLNQRKSSKFRPFQLLKRVARTMVFKVVVLLFVAGFIAATGFVIYRYEQDSRTIDRFLGGELFQHTARLFARPYHIYPGQKLRPENVVARLQRAGYEPSGAKSAENGFYQVATNKITLEPSTGEPVRLEFDKGVLTRIVKSKSGEAEEAWLPPELVTNLFNQSREKRRIVEFSELPPILVNALIAQEDRRFYGHWGIDPIRLVGAVVASIRDSHRIEGTSTLTQQLCKNFFLTVDRSPSRKIHEMFMALLLERKTSKEQILTMYANDINLGQRGSFNIRGFSEGAATFFGKDLTALTLPEAATLVGIIPAPNGAYSPTKHPEEVKKRRNLVLTAMADMGKITKDEAAKAKATPLNIIPVKIDSSDAPYLVDYIREGLLRDFSDDSLINDNLSVYTTIDPELQSAAVDAVSKGLKAVEDLLAPRYKGKKDADKRPHPQAAMIAMERSTGGIVAMVGGSDYGASQFNRITQAFRQPGSIFKPLVYAAAIEASQGAPGASAPAASEDAGGDHETSSSQVGTVADSPAAASPAQTKADGRITPVTMLINHPVTFTYDGTHTYEPGNFHDEYEKYGDPVSVRVALEHSLNVPTVEVAEMIGYDKVAALAQRAGMNGKIKPFPSIALGAFEVTPLEIARAWTMFANDGKRLEPHALLRVVGGNGKLNKDYNYTQTPVISPQVAYMMTHLLEGVIAEGTAASVRSRGFELPAAGKTGTSRDGWFAGYTKDYLVITWVGFDNNDDLNLEGAKSALPIWTDFMIKAAQLYPPVDIDEMEFTAPEGIDFVKIDPLSHLPANSACPETYSEAFISGTVPTMMCPLHGGNPVSKTVRGIGAAVGNFFGRLFSSKSDTPAEPSTSSR
jgi:penicillin-binding protein 1B